MQEENKLKSPKLLSSCLNLIVNAIPELFFHVYPIDSKSVPEAGVPTIIIAAPHWNYFLDPLLVMHAVQHRNVGKENVSVIPLNILVVLTFFYHINFSMLYSVIDQVFQYSFSCT